MTKVVVVTGGSSGIGREACRLFAKESHSVYELSRRNIPLENVTHIECDITDGKSVENAISLIISKEGRIDLLVNNAGSGISGAVEFTSQESVFKAVSVLFLGLDNVTRSCLPYLRSTKGRIINISSVAAVLSIPFQTYYSAMKSAVNGYTLGLANEVRQFGVTVCALMPGDTKTGFTSARSTSVEGDDIYCGMISRSVSVMENDEQNGTACTAVAAKIVKLSQKKHIKPLYTVGIKYKLFCALAKLLPAGLVNSIVGSIYAK